MVSFVGRPTLSSAAAKPAGDRHRVPQSATGAIANDLDHVYCTFAAVAASLKTRRLGERASLRSSQ